MSGIWPNCDRSPTIDAHLFPRALAHDMRGQHKHLLVGSATNPGRKIQQAGVSDKNILCKECDGHLGNYDKFGIEFCRSFGKTHQALTTAIFRISPVDTDRLARFFLAILWRFSISKVPEAKHVSLGPFENNFRDILFLGLSCNTEPAVTMLRYRSSIIAAENICYAPFRSRFMDIQGLNAYTVCIGGFRVCVKTDSRPAPPDVRPPIINGKTGIIGGFVDFEQTSEYKSSVRIAHNMAQMAPRPLRP